MEVKIGKHFKMGKRVGHGAFGEIFEGVNTVTSQAVAIKMEQCSSQAPQLEHEHNLYQLLQGQRKLLNLSISGSFQCILFRP